MPETKIVLTTTEAVSLSPERYNELIGYEKDSLRQRDYDLSYLLQHFMRYCRHDIGCRGSWNVPKECTCGLQAVLDDTLYAMLLDRMVMKWCKKHRGGVFVLPEVEFCPNMESSSNHGSSICCGLLDERPIL